MKDQTNNQSLTHDDQKMPLKDRIQESQEYGETFRAEHAGRDEFENQDSKTIRQPDKKSDDEKFGS